MIIHTYTKHDCIDTQPFKPTARAHIYTRTQTLPLPLVRMMIMMMMMGVPDLDISAGLRLSRDALWLEIYNSLTSASLVDFLPRKVSWFGVTRACMSVCMSEVIASLLLFQWFEGQLREISPASVFPSLYVVSMCFLCLAKALHSGLWVAWHELISNIWMLSGCSLPSPLKS